MSRKEKTTVERMEKPKVSYFDQKGLSKNLISFCKRFFLNAWTITIVGGLLTILITYTKPWKFVERSFLTTEKREFTNRLDNYWEMYVKDDKKVVGYMGTSIRLPEAYLYDKNNTSIERFHLSFTVNKGDGFIFVKGREKGHHLEIPNYSPGEYPIFWELGNKPQLNSLSIKTDSAPEKILNILTVDSLKLWKIKNQFPVTHGYANLNLNWQIGGWVSAFPNSVFDVSFFNFDLLVSDLYKRAIIAPVRWTVVDGDAQFLSETDNSYSSSVETVSRFGHYPDYGYTRLEIPRIKVGVARTNIIEVNSSGSVKPVFFTVDVDKPTKLLPAISYGNQYFYPAQPDTKSTVIPLHCFGIAAQNWKSDQINGCPLVFESLKNCRLADAFKSYNFSFYKKRIEIPTYYGGVAFVGIYPENVSPGQSVKVRVSLEDGEQSLELVGEFSEIDTCYEVSNFAQFPYPQLFRVTESNWQNYLSENVMIKVVTRGNLPLSGVPVKFYELGDNKGSIRDNANVSTMGNGIAMVRVTPPIKLVALIGRKPEFRIEINRQ